MPEQSPYPNESKEDYKERIKKLKAKTSKMRLAVANKKLAKKDSRGFDIVDDAPDFDISSFKKKDLDKAKKKNEEAKFINKNTTIGK